MSERHIQQSRIPRFSGMLWMTSWRYHVNQDWCHQMTLMMTCPSLVIESDFNIDSPCMGFELTEDEVNYIKQVEDEEKKQRADDAQRGREIMETFLSTSRAARCASRRLLNYKPGECTTTNRLRATIAEFFCHRLPCCRLNKLLHQESYWVWRPQICSCWHFLRCNGIRRWGCSVYWLWFTWCYSTLWLSLTVNCPALWQTWLGGQIATREMTVSFWARILHLAMAKGNDYAERLSAGKKFIPIGEFATLRADPICTSIFEDMTKSAKENKHTFQPDLKIALKRGSFNSIEDRVMLLGKLRQTRAFGTNFFSARRFSMT